MHKFRWSPSEFLKLPREEKAFVAASIQMKIKKDEEDSKKMKAKSSRRKR